jgi:hypothetical protein
MTGPDVDPEDEILRQFNEIIAGLGPEGLRELGLPLLAAVGRGEPPRRTESLRRPKRDVPVKLVIRVDINHASPPIWRRLEVRSDISLATVHQVLQSAFGWWDYHLHRFSLGGDPFDRNAELFLCPYDVLEGDEDGVPDTDVRLDEALGEPGDVLNYLYDYGDHWDLQIVLEQVAPLPTDAPIARCIDGRRAAPPEDCGSLRTAEELAEVLDDPAAFSVDEVNAALLDPFASLAEQGLRRDLVDILARLRATAIGDEAVVRAVGLRSEPVTSMDERAAALQPILWFLDHVGTDGLALTSAGYLRPADVVALFGVLPETSDWIGPRNRESHAGPVLHFREAMQAVGLVRKAKGHLHLTKAGVRARGNPDALWQHLAQRLPTGKAGTFEGMSGLLLLLFSASSPRSDEPFDAVATAMTTLDWRYGTGEPVAGHHVRWATVTTLAILRNVTTEPRVWSLDSRRQLSVVAADLARDCLLPPGGPELR